MHGSFDGSAWLASKRFAMHASRVSWHNSVAQLADHLLDVRLCTCSSCTVHCHAFPANAASCHPFPRTQKLCGLEDVQSEFMCSINVSMFGCKAKMQVAKKSESNAVSDVISECSTVRMKPVQRKCILICLHMRFWK